MPPIEEANIPEVDALGLERGEPTEANPDAEATSSKGLFLPSLPNKAKLKKRL